MSTAGILALGAVAGFTIFLGLPIGRLRSPRVELTAFLSAIATGVLVFLLWDVLTAGIEPVEDALVAAEEHSGSWARFAGLSTIFGACFALGLLGLVYYDRYVAQRRRSFVSVGAATAAELDAAAAGAFSPARWLALMIATGIGVHNFAEGLAIGQSAGGGEVDLALMLVIGFGLHNATEGFGIVAPLSGERVPPSWRFLFALGLIGGGPTFLGTLLGRSWVSDPVSVGFLAVAAGSILYVVLELVGVCRRFGSKSALAWGIVLGLFLGLATDFVLVAAGA
jgi:zinc transporter, ZIP family